jgi:hypothetical protein
MGPGEQFLEITREAEELLADLATRLAALPPEARAVVRLKLQTVIQDFSRLLSVTAPALETSVEAEDAAKAAI